MGGGSSKKVMPNQVQVAPAVDKRARARGNWNKVRIFVTAKSVHKRMQLDKWSRATDKLRQSEVDSQNRLEPLANAPTVGAADKTSAEREPSTSDMQSPPPASRGRRMSQAAIQFGRRMSQAAVDVAHAAVAPVLSMKEKRDKQKRDAKEDARKEAEIKEAERLAEIARKEEEEIDRIEGQKEWEVLRDIWVSTNGPEWLANKGGWADLAEHKQCARCEGVDVDGDGRPIAIKLYDSGLTGKLPKSLGRLKRLQILNLRGNALEGELPQNIGNAVHLKIVRLNGNRFEGEIPMSLYIADKMEELNLRGNNFTGVLLDAIASMENLAHLDLSGNNLTGDVPGALEFCEHLVYMDISDNQFDGVFGPTELLKKKGLKVGISGNPFKVKGLYTDGNENFVHVERRRSQVGEGFGGFRNQAVGAQIW